MDEQVPRNWQTELELVNMKKATAYLRLKGQIPYTVTFLDEGGAAYQAEFDDRLLDRVNFKVKASGGEYTGQELTWSFTKGGPDSLYGKMVTLFVRNGKSTGLTIHIVGEGEGRTRKYQIKEYNDLVFSGVVGGQK